MSQGLSIKFPTRIFKYKKTILQAFLSLGILITMQIIKYYLIMKKNIINNWTWEDSLWIKIETHLNDKLWWDKLDIMQNPILAIVWQGVVLFLFAICFFFILRKQTWRIWWWIIFLGSLGNYINRLWYYPYVIDYFLISSEKIKIYFNLEDLMIWFGFLGVLLWLLKQFFQRVFYKQKY